jgi:hypothetical protein
METMDIVSLIGSAISFIGVIFVVYLSFRNPQIANEKEHIEIEQEVKDKATLLSQKEVENKASVLEKQFQWYMDATERKFADFGKRLEDAFLMASNHTHTVDTKVDKLIESTNSLGLTVERLSTIIEERIPRK